MKPTLFGFGASTMAATLALGATLALAAPLAAQDKPTLAVLDLQDGGSIGPDAQDLSRLGVGLAMMLTTEMSRNDRVTMVERDQIQDIVAEHRLNLSGMVDPSTAAEVGRLLGAKYVLLGGFTDVFSNLRIDVRVVDVETGRIIRAQEQTSERENLFRSVSRLAEALFRDLELQPAGPTPQPAPVPARAVIFFSRGVGYEDAGDSAQAAAMYRRALEIHADYADARERLARIEGAGA